MARALGTWAELWVGLGLGCVAGAAVVGAFDAWELATMDGTAIRRSEGFGAVLKVENRGYVLETDSGTRITCSRDFCGYPSVATDLDVRRNFCMSSGRLIGVERGDQWIDLRPEIAASKRNKLAVAGALLAMALPCFWAGLKARRQARLGLTGVRA